jgi:hypothetical protein
MQGENGKAKGKKQEKIDRMLEKQTGLQEFTHDGVIEAVAKFVACDDQVWHE